MVTVRSSVIAINTIGNLIRKHHAISVLALLAGIIMPANAGAQNTQGKNPLKIEILHENPLKLAGDDKPDYVLVRLNAAEQRRDALAQERPPINLALVLDRSGSMEEKGKLDYLKRAASLVVDQLGSRDRLAIVEYDDAITLMWPSSRVESPQIIKRLISELTPRGSTNLTGGMMRGAEEVIEHFEPNSVNRVLLLSDGLANNGITDPYEIRRLVRGARAKGAPISSIGLGLDYNEDLMQDIAEGGGGRYYYVESPQQMARIFEEELKTLFATCARDVSLRFIPARNDARIEVPGYDSRKENGETLIPLADLYAGESRSVLMRIQGGTARTGRMGLEETELGEMELGEIVLSYRDADTGREHKIRQKLSVDLTRDAAQVKAKRNNDVVVEAALVEAEEAQ